MTQWTTEQLAELFREAGAAHHVAFAATDGDDPQWPVWYAEYLAARLEGALGRRFDPSALAADLRRVDEDHRRARKGEPWPEFYARWFLDHAKR